MSVDLTEQEIRDTAELMQKRYGRSVDFFISWIKEDAFASSRKHVAARLNDVQQAPEASPLAPLA